MVVLVVLLVFEVSSLLRDDCDDTDGAAVCCLSLVTDAANVSTGDHRLLGRFPFSFRGFRGGVGGDWGGTEMLGFDSLLLSSNSSCSERPCLPIRMNGTKMREIPANAVVAMKVLVYASSG